MARIAIDVRSARTFRERAAQQAGASAQVGKPIAEEGPNLIE